MFIKSVPKGFDMGEGCACRRGQFFEKGVRRAHKYLPLLGEWLQGGIDRLEVGGGGLKIPQFQIM